VGWQVVSSSPPCGYRYRATILDWLPQRGELLIFYQLQAKNQNGCAAVYWITTGLLAQCGFED